VLVVETAAVTAVEQLARDIGRVKKPGFLILELMEATAAAAIAQCLPFAAVERGKGLLPERRWGSVHLKSSLALLSAGDQARIVRA
jgi:hypothetical protein